MRAVNYIPILPMAGFPQEEEKGFLLSYSVPSLIRYSTPTQNLFWHGWASRELQLPSRLPGPSPVSGYVDRMDAVDQADPYMYLQLGRQKLLDCFTQNYTSIAQTYTGPLDGIRVLLKHAYKDNDQITLRDTASEPSCSEVQAITREKILGQHLPVYLLVAAHDCRQFKCSFTSGEIDCAVYFDAASDDVLLVNIGQPVLVQRAAEGATAERLLSEMQKVLSPTLWLISAPDHPDQAIEVLVRPRPYQICVEGVADGNDGKRSSSSAIPLSSNKRARQLSGPFYMSDKAASPATRISIPESQETVSRPLQPHELSQTAAGQTIVFRNNVTRRRDYELERVSSWVRSNSQMDMFTAILRSEHEDPILVCVRMYNLLGMGWKDLSEEAQSNAIDTANMWRQSCKAFMELCRPNIASCVGADFRHLSLYVHWPGYKTLEKYWCKDGYFTGTLDDARVILADCAQALLYMRFKDIQHLDICPANIVYPPGCRAILFGIDHALWTSDNHSLKAPGGNPCYTTPDFVKCQGHERLGVWSLGVTMLYAMRLTALPGTKAYVDSLGQTSATRMRTWFQKVEELRVTLLAPVDGEAPRDTKLKGIVAQMLLAPGKTESHTIISVTELADSTMEWASAAER